MTWESNLKSNFGVKLEMDKALKSSKPKMLYFVIEDGVWFTLF
jgi:hypothetical protein